MSMLRCAASCSEMSAQGDERVVEASELLKVDAPFIERADDGTAGCGSKING